jgi:hypothetical protein
MEGQGVVLAEGVEVDRPFDDLADAAIGPTTALRGESGQQLLVALVARGRVEQRFDVSRRGALGAGGLEVHAEGFEDLGHVALISLPGLGTDYSGVDPFPGGEVLGIFGDAGHSAPPLIDVDPM